MNESLQALLAAVVDYAGLFPPASLDMAAAVQSYAHYIGDPDRRMLGRFVVPGVRLREFDDAAAHLLPRGDGSDPWHLSALPGPDITADIDLALKFNCRHWSGSEIGHAVIDALEMKGPTVPEIEAAMAIMPRQFSAYFEIPITDDPTVLIRAIKRAGGSAKIRTGGITTSAFPEADDVVRFMLACREERLPFKLTAGLHHPIRAEYRLTYADDPPRGVMFGYLNMFVAAVLAWSGADKATVRAAMVATDAADFRFTNDSIRFCDRTVTAALVRDARKHFVISFGSCSFREPVDDLHALAIS